MSVTAQNDVYKPYLHQAKVPDHKKLDLLGSFKVDLFTGAATFDYAVQTPPGTNGLKPELSLLYNSHHTYDVPTTLGTGWSLTENYIQRDTNYTPSAIADDEFILYLDGAKHDLIYVPQEDRYHTKIESYLFIKKEEGANNQKGEYWLVKTPDGTEYRFGYTHDSEAISNRHNHVWRWYLDEVTDTHENTITYTYQEQPFPSSTGSTYLTKIEYNNDKKRVIEFEYGSSQRPDMWKVFDNGHYLRESRLLDHINVYADDNLVSRNALDYSSLGHATRQFIHKIHHTGNDGATSLQPIELSYNAINKGWSRNEGYEIPSSAAFNHKPTGADLGVRFAELNGDGLLDLLERRDCSQGECRGAWINTGSGWSSDSKWELPSDASFVDDNGQDLGVRVLDFNGDGRDDIIRCNEDVNPKQKAWLNTGSGWTQYDTWLPPSLDACFVDNSGEDQGVRIVDVNGDGLPDLVRSNEDINPKRVTWINTGNGWAQDSTWLAPDYFVDNSGQDLGLRFADINGDGLIDILKHREPSSSSNRKTWINTGNGWESDSTWLPPLFHPFVDSGGGDQGVRIMDANGDGLDDLIKHLDCSAGHCRVSYLNNGNGWSEDSPWELLFVPFIDDDSSTAGVKIADVNGDALPDIVRRRSGVTVTCNSDPCKGTYLNNAGQGYLLNEIKNEFGGTTTIHYTSSTRKDNTGDDAISDLNFNLWLVSSTYENNALSEPFQTIVQTDYDYRGGLYDYQDDEFRGFSQVTQTYDSVRETTHLFHQDDARQGRLRQVATRDTGDSLYRIETQEWKNKTRQGVWEVTLASTTEYAHDGHNDDPIITQEKYEYDVYGNIVEIHQQGNINIPGDERYHYTHYTPNPEEWIVNKPANVSVVASDNHTRVSLVRYAYDNQEFSAPPTTGDLTKSQQWLATGQDPTTMFEYDQYGNVVQEINPKGHITKYIFGITDDTHTFPNRMTNAKNQHTNYEYDLGTGNLLSTRDHNGFTTTYTYDEFGRVSKEIRPYDTLALPTIEYEYQFNAQLPHHIKTLKREESNEEPTLDATQYYDGFARLIQDQQEGHGQKQIAANIHYDSAGRTEKVTNPFFTEKIPSLAYCSINYDIPWDDRKQSTTQFEPGESELFPIVYPWANSTIRIKLNAPFIVRNAVLDLAPREKMGITETERNPDRDFDDWIEQPEDYIGQGIIAPITGNFESGNFYARGFGSDFSVTISTTPAGGPLPNGYVEERTGHSTGWWGFTFPNQGPQVVQGQTYYMTIRPLTHEDDMNVHWSFDGYPNACAYCSSSDCEDNFEDCDRDLAFNAHFINEESNFLNPTIRGFNQTLFWSYEGELEDPQVINITQGLNEFIQTQCIEHRNQTCIVPLFIRSEGKARINLTNLEVEYDQCADPSLIAFTQYTYDPLDRITAVKNPDNTQKSVEFDRSQITTYDENNHELEYFIDGQRRITHIVEYESDIPYVTRYTYNQRDEMTSIQDTKGNAINYTYDSLGRRTSLIDPDLGTWNYTYDANGNLETQQDNRGILTTLEYDKLNRVTSKSSDAQETIYVYDQPTVGTLSSAQTDQTLVTYAYDDRLRKLSQQVDVLGQQFTTLYSYDALDRLTSKRLPNRDHIILEYDQQGLVERIPDALSAVEYNEFGQPVLRTYENALQTAHDYYEHNQRLQRIHTPSLQDLNYDYDNEGNLEHIENTIDNTEQTMHYDDLDRLKTVEKKDQSNKKIVSASYAYDPIGNIISSTVNGQFHSYIYGLWPAHSPLNITTNITIPAKRLFVLKNDQQDIVSYIDSEGNLVLLSRLSTFSSHQPSDNATFAVQNQGTYVFSIEGNGSAYLRRGITQNTSISPTNNTRDFLVRNDRNNPVFHLNESGHVFLRGVLREHQEIAAEE